MQNGKIFISHAHFDMGLVSAFVALLERGAGVPSKNIFCTSQNGRGIPIGDDFKNRIKQELENSVATIAIITPTYYKSNFCMCELGAVWGRGGVLLPIVVPPIEASELKAVASGLQAIELHNEYHLDLLRDQLCTYNHEFRTTTVAWNEAKAKFIVEALEKYRAVSPERSAGEYLLKKHVEGIASFLNVWMLENIGACDAFPYLILWDIDRLKQINKLHGITIANKVLQLFRGILKSRSQSFLMQGMCGDDTFFGLTFGTEVRAKELANEVLTAVANIPSQLGIDNLWVTSSVSVAKYIKDQSLDEWTSRLAISIESARKEGGNTVKVAKDYAPSPRSWS